MMWSIWLIAMALVVPASSESVDKSKDDQATRWQYEDCKETMRGDILFVVDASGSIGVRKFKEIKDFIGNLLDMEDMTLGPQNVQVGLILFSRSVLRNIRLDAYTSTEDFKDAVKNLTYLKGTSRLGQALRVARTQVLTRASSLIVSVPQVIVVITDGAVSDESLVLEELNKLRGRGVHAIFVGVGEKRALTKLRQFALTPSNAVLKEHWQGLEKYVPALVQKTSCKTVMMEKVTHCQRSFKADVVFVLDSSTSLGERNFYILKNFIMNVTNAFDVLGSNGVQVALVQYSRRAKIVFGLDTYSDKAQLQNAIRNVPYKRGPTRTGYALYRVDRTVLKQRRPTVKSTIVILTDGKATDNVMPPAKILHQKKYNVMAVGVGNETQINEVELRAIASKPVATHVFHASNFEQLPTFISYIITSVCNTH